jgi:hypothetical protein
LYPKITSGTATVILGTPQFDSGITVAVTQSTLNPGHGGVISVTAGSIPGFYHYSIPSTDSTGVAQQQSGWILVGNSPASLTKTDDNQKGAAGSNLTLSVTLNRGNRAEAPLEAQSSSRPAPERFQAARNNKLIGYRLGCADASIDCRNRACDC